MKIKDTGVMNGSWVRGHKNRLFINNMFLEIMGYTTKKSDLRSLDFAQKCPRNAGNAI